MSLFTGGGGLIFGWAYIRSRQVYDDTRLFVFKALEYAKTIPKLVVLVAKGPYFHDEPRQQFFHRRILTTGKVRIKVLIIRVVTEIY
jgi:hypothetical protein